MPILVSAWGQAETPITMDETMLRQAVDRRGKKKTPVNMAQADCLKTIFRIAAELDPRYLILANDLEGRIYEDWMIRVKTDYIRERFYAMGGRRIDDPTTGDILFFALRHHPVDHAGLALNNREFVHLTPRGLRMGRVDKYRPVSAGRII